MPKRVAVETQLTAVEEILRDKGYDVVQLDPLSPSGAELQDLQAVVITGQDENMLGREDMQTTAPVIDARGLSAEEIVQQLEKSVRKGARETQEVQGGEGFEERSVLKGR